MNRLPNKYGVLGLLAASLMLILIFGNEADGQYRRADVYGQILDARGRPIPGVTINLINPELGLRYEWLTDGGGGYRFMNVPVPGRGPLWIEAFWGPNLMYRDIVPMLGLQAPIYLR